MPNPNAALNATWPCADGSAASGMPLPAHQCTRPETGSDAPKQAGSAALSRSQRCGRRRRRHRQHRLDASDPRRSGLGWRSVRTPCLPRLLSWSTRRQLRLPGTVSQFGRRRLPDGRPLRFSGAERRGNGDDSVGSIHTRAMAALGPRKAAACGQSKASGRQSTPRAAAPPPPCTLESMGATGLQTSVTHWNGGGARRSTGWIGARAAAGRVSLFGRRRLPDGRPLRYSGAGQCEGLPHLAWTMCKPVPGDGVPRWDPEMRCRRCDAPAGRQRRHRQHRLDASDPRRSGLEGRPSRTQ
jgi:hypothetical protein